MRRSLLLVFLPFLTYAANEPEGAAIYRRACAVCHNSTQPGRTPSEAALRQMASFAILQALTTGVMKQQGASLTQAERESVAAWLGVVSTPKPGEEVSHVCVANGPASHTTAGWTSWGGNLENWRYQPAADAGLSVGTVPHLKLKWAFGLPGVSLMRSQPVVYAGRVYLGGDNGAVYSIDADTGCVYWSTRTKQVRSGLSVGKAGSADAVFFGDVAGGLTALDVNSGGLLWHTSLGEDPHTMVTSTPAFVQGRLYVGLSSYEELAAMFPGYACCGFRGGVVAVDAEHGGVLWRTHTISEESKPQRTASDGRTFKGPSGAGVWSSPTIDLEKKRLYVVTGNNYSDPPTSTSDSLLALDLDSGRILWSKQFTEGDAYNMACGEAGKGACPAAGGPDFDFGSSPILVRLSSGKRELLLGQKSGLIYAVDPDAEGRILWQDRVGEGGALGGIQWGPATDGHKMYVALSDVRFRKSTDPTKLNLDPEKGGGMFAYSVDNGKQLWKTDAPPCRDRVPCSPAQSAAITAIPGVVFSGSLSGHIYAYNTETGAIIWDFDTVRDFETVNHVPGKGGSLDAGGPVVAGGMLYVNSGYPQYGGMGGNVLLAFGVE